MDEATASVPATPATERKMVLLAPWWHTVSLVALLLTVSYFSAGQLHAVSRKGDTMLLYAFTVIYEFILLGLVWLGVRSRGVSLPDLIGGKWVTLGDFFLDLAIAAGFWIVAVLVLASLGYLLGLGKGTAQIDQAKKIIEMMAPRDALELMAFAGLSCVAGFCEEIIFRGYLQRQFGILSRNLWMGMFCSAAVFGLAHAYEGKQRMFIIAVYGAMFGSLAILRKSLRPGMIAHAWHDSFQGGLLFFASRLLKSGVLK